MYLRRVLQHFRSFHVYDFFCLLIFPEIFLDLGLPEDVIGEAKCAWRKVVTLANGSRHSNFLESQFFPMFDGIATGLHHVEGW